MKHKFFLLMMILVLLFRNGYSQDKYYEINGHIEGLYNGEKVLMKLFHGNNMGDYTRSDSGYVKDGMFHIKGFVPEGPRFYWIEFDKHPTQYSTLLIDNGEQITISGKIDINKIKHNLIRHYIQVDGSPSNHAFESFVTADQIFTQNMGNVNNYLSKIKDSVGFDKNAVDELMKFKNLINQTFYYTLLYKPEPDYVQDIPLLMTEFFSKTNHAPFWANVYRELPPNLQNSFYGKKSKELIGLCVGQPFPEFTLPDINGNQLAIRSIIDKSKITIVHFWASGSSSIDKFQQELLFLYKKYHDKGLNVIGVSSDISERKWKISSADLPWFQVSDLKGKDGVVEKIYKEEAGLATTNVLIDSDGKIIAWDVYGPELQWYLYKYLGE